MTPEPTGELIAGRYEVLETIRHHERGSVLRACDRADDRLVALKIRTGPRADEQSNLPGEVSVLLRVAPHPGLPTVRDELFLDAGERHVIVMDWIDGRDLDRLRTDAEGGRLPPATVVDVVSQAAEILDHLHHQDPFVIHGDVKPSNLVLTNDGAVVLIDFDIAGSGSFHRVAGTIGHTAPEVATGGAVTPAIDVYGLAATAVTLLTGAPPGPGSLGLPDDHGATDGLALALRRGLSVDPARRPASAGELAAQLRAAARR